MKKLFTALLLATQIAIAQAQTVVQVEYFLDVDASFATGTLIDLTPSVDSTYEITVNLPANISPGYHKLYIRTKNSNGHWSQTIRRNIEVVPQQLQNNIITGEYFFDTDPGFGSATSYTVATSDTDVTHLFTANVLANVEAGYHNIIESSSQMFCRQSKKASATQSASELNTAIFAGSIPNFFVQLVVGKVA